MSSKYSVLNIVSCVGTHCPVFYVITYTLYEYFNSYLYRLLILIFLFNTNSNFKFLDLKIYYVIYSCTLR